MPRIDEFFREVDSRWGAPPGVKVPLRIIGSSALMLQTSYERGTKDSDVLETADITVDVRRRLLEIGGKGSVLHTKHRLFVEFVSSGLPFLPQVSLYHPQATLNAALRCFEVHVLDVVDVVVAKLKRFHADDRSDIDAMLEMDLVPHGRLLSRFLAAVDAFACDARAEELPRYVRNLHVVERDLLGLPETPIDLPEWIGR